MNKECIEKKYCCGCGLCSYKVPGEFNEKGYYRPLSKDLRNHFETDLCYCNQLQNVVQDSFWGNYEHVYYGYSLDDSIRKKASSGGILTEVACYLLEKKFVDYVVQVKFSADNPVETEVCFNRTSDEVKSCCGSRYSPSASLYKLIENIDLNKKYAVIGKPCDMRVLRGFLNLHPEFQSSILYLLSFFCGGTPSSQANQKLLQHMGLNKDSLSSFDYRGNGWPGKTMGTDGSGKSVSVEYETSWGEILGRDLQDICRFCWEGVGEAADICCGDGWYLKNKKPNFEEADGRNVIFARSQKGDGLLKEMFVKNKIYLEEISDVQILKYMQPGQYMRKAAMFSRTSAMKIMNKPVPKYRVSKIIRYFNYLTPVHNFKMFGGTIKRILSGRIQ